MQGTDVYASVGTQTFDDKDVATGKTMTATGASITDGNGGANYNITYVTDLTGEITIRDLTVTAIGIDKVYDGNTTATVDLSTDKVSGDDV